MNNPAFEEDKTVESDATSVADEDYNSHCGSVDTEATEASGDSSGLLYKVYDRPAWYTSILLGLQHCLLSIGGLIGIPLILASELCMPPDEVGYVARAMVLNSLFFVSGIMTFLQTTFGTRLPIVQGGSFSFLPPTLAILSLPQNDCPTDPIDTNLTGGAILYNDTDGEIVDGSELWMKRMRQVQGAIATASAIEIVLGVTGAIGFLMRFISPLTVGIAIALIGLPLFETAAASASTQWGIAFFTMGVLIIFSQYLNRFSLPFPLYSKSKGCHISKTNFIRMFPVLIAIVSAWLLCLILTETGVFPDEPGQYGYLARTDVKLEVIESSPWFKFPYPGQWGLPVVTVAGFLGMLPGVIAGILESVGDYYACARLSGAPPIAEHAINRGIVIEGFGCVLSGLVGTGCGTTSYSENIGAIGITRVASRLVLQIAGIFFIVVGMIGKFGAVFVLIPDPVIGGLFFVLFGMIVAVGLSNLQYVDLNSSRNLFVIGFSLFSGLAIPVWVKQHPEAINTGVDWLDQVVLVLLETSIIVGGFFAVFFDNTLPGTLEERGIIAWKGGNSSGGSVEDDAQKSELLAKCYNLPFSTNWRYSRYVPFLPEYGKKVKVMEEESSRLLKYFGLPFFLFPCG